MMNNLSEFPICKHEWKFIIDSSKLVKGWPGGGGGRGLIQEFYKIIY